MSGPKREARRPHDPDERGDRAADARHEVQGAAPTRSSRPSSSRRWPRPSSPAGLTNASARAGRTSPQPASRPSRRPSRAMSTASRRPRARARKAAAARGATGPRPRRPKMDIPRGRVHNGAATCSTCNYMRSPNKRLALRNRTLALLCPSTFKHGTGYLQGKGLTRRWTSRVYVGPKDARRKRICLVGTPSAMPGVFFGVAPGRGVSSHREPNRKGNA